jgi:ribosomal protein L20
MVMLRAWGVSFAHELRQACLRWAPALEQQQHHHLCQSKQFIKRSSVAYCYWCRQLRKREMRASHNANQRKLPVHHSHHCRHFSFIIQLNFSKFKEGLHSCCDLNLIGLNGRHYQQHIANL